MKPVRQGNDFPLRIALKFSPHEHGLNESTKGLLPSFIRANPDDKIYRHSFNRL